MQWIADRQLLACRDLARKRGLKVGLYLDVAVGVQSDGFDAWNEQVAISRHLAVGAPPDPLNTSGQNWGLAGFNAAGLEISSFEPYREMLRASMRYAGAIRLDHVLGLKRLYLVPHGFAANNGVYVQMPFEALLATTAQESMAHRCVVIGEDLGTVPEGFRDQIADWGIWSYQVMMFERDDHGRFRGVDHYKPNALVTFNTHDLSTYAGWRGFSDLALKRSLGIDPGESDDARWHALAMLTDVLRHHAIDRDDLYAVAGFLARTRSRLLAISLEDLLGVVDQPNIPGTVDEHPNWRRRLPLPIDAIAAAIDLAALRHATGERTRAASVKQHAWNGADLACKNRRLWIDRRLRNRGIGRPRWFDRLAVLARVRFRCVFCKPAGHAAAGSMADRACGGCKGNLAPVLGQYPDPGDAI